MTRRAERERSERTAFPRCGDYLAVVKFMCGTPEQDRDRVYAAPVKGQPGLFNFALFPAPVTRTPEQNQILEAAEAVAKLTRAARQA